MVGDDRVVFVCSNFSSLFCVLEFVQDSFLRSAIPIGRKAVWMRTDNKEIGNFVGGCLWGALGVGAVMCADVLALKWIIYPRSY
jgi:hypothetical protein